MISRKWCDITARRMCTGLIWVLTLAGVLSQAQATPRVSTFAAHAMHSVSVHSDGTLWAVGNNDAGQLGDGTTDSHVVPVQIDATRTWATVATGERHSVALQTDGSLWAWGDNTLGQLGDGTTSARLSPVRICADTRWLAVAAGSFHTLALKKDHTLWAWGANMRGQLGNGATLNQFEPVPVLTDVDTLAAGYQHSLAIKSDGTLWAWGWNGYGQAGPATMQDSWRPVQIGNVRTWMGVAAGSYHSVAWQRDGTLWSWGRNDSGQLGVGTLSPQSGPVQVAGLTEVLAAAPGASHTLAVRRNGTLFAWGLNSEGQVDEASVLNHPSPIQIGSAMHWSAVAAGQGWSAAVTDTGWVWAWGRGNILSQFDQASPQPALNPPVITTVPARTATVDTPYHYFFSVIDPDSEPFLRTAHKLPVWLSFNNSTGELTGTPSVADVGTHHIVLNASDGVLNTQYRFTIDVSGGISFDQVLDLTFDDAQTMQTSDASAKGLHAHLTNTASEQSFDGRALLVNGAGHATVANHAALDFTASLTLEAWIKPTINDQHAAIIARNDPAALQFAYGLGLRRGALSATLENQNYISMYTVPVHVWTHIAMVWNGVTLRLFANGEEVYRASATATALAQTQPVFIGARSALTGNSTEGFVGSIDRVRLWRVAREVSALCIEAGRVWQDMHCTGAIYGHAIPVAISASYVLIAGGVLTGQFAATETASESLTYLLADKPHKGTVRILDPHTGAFRYIPGMSGVDTFSFRVANHFGLSELATISLTTNAGGAVDTDGDGMLDATEAALGLDLKNSADAALDMDEDGVNNGHEVTIARDPTIPFETDAQHVLGLSFREGAGVVAQDATLAANHGELVGSAVRWVAGLQGNAVAMSDNAGVRVPDEASLDMAEALTLELWVKPLASEQTSYVIAKNATHGASTFNYGIGLINGRLRGVLTGDVYASNYIVPVQVWTHVALTWDGAKVRLYANGTQIASGARTAALSVNDAPLVIGARNAGVTALEQGFTGEIDQVNLWRGALSSAEVCSASAGKWISGGCTH